ncbi:ABC transporter ATP-binding protein [Thermococcus argininiproducens]|uniref:ABC transporter ATP-binding protein n=1 Tax=Thermococcus argininiproducens TaxID=2866384 RepID=A0A9E7MBW9_9EURY|nr:ABC transporter ATP-binding protein [Thermococcus argininiproducens]USH00648.1 ABC transporter ATP-binding protein [Thermococcus argininiproducens]
MIVHAKNLQKCFGSVTALAGVSVKIPKGLTLILGPNGGGKSTFMKLSLGLYKPTQGEIKLLGKDPWKNADIRKNIGVAFDPPAIPKLITGKEWLSFLAETKNLNVQKEVLKVSKLFDIGGFLRRRIESYSSGMFKRLSLAQAFLGEPEVIFLDEPFANIDFESIAKIISIIAEKKITGTDFVIISHIWEPLINMADYIVVLSAGKVYLEGRADKIEEDIENLFRLPNSLLR